MNDPKIKQKEKEAYETKKNDPDFQEKNRARARKWNKDNPAKHNATKRKK